jgi:uncharacterized membrane protein
MSARKKERNNIFVQMHPLTRLGVSVGLAVIAYFVLKNDEISILLRAMVSWIVFSLTFLICSWIVIDQRTVSQIRKKATEDDGSVAFVFFMVLISSLSGLLAVLLIVISKDSSIRESVLFLPSCILGILLSWGMVHTIYVGGLVFPEENEPDYLDFAYYSFGLGCTFQVSDVNVTSRKIRRITLFHSLLSFVLNTFVVALTINLIAGLN